MALQLTTSNSFIGFTFNNAYWRIISLSYSHNAGTDNKVIVYSIEAFISEIVANTLGSQSINSYYGSFVPDVSVGAKDWLSQAYDDAKTQVQFQNSVDV